MTYVARYATYLIIGIVAVMSIICWGVLLGEMGSFMNVLMFPGELLVSYGPGGEENLLNWVFAAGAQSMIYACVAAVAHRMLSARGR